MAKSKPLNMHGKCRAIHHGSSTLICGKSPEHTDSEDPRKQRHYGVSKQIYWTDDGVEERADG